MRLFVDKYLIFDYNNYRNFTYDIKKYIYWHAKHLYLLRGLVTVAYFVKSNYFPCFKTLLCIFKTHILIFVQDIVNSVCLVLYFVLL